MALGSVDVARSGSMERVDVRSWAGRPIVPPSVAGERDLTARPEATAAVPLGGSGRTELFVVLLIAVMGMALASAVAFAPWHPTANGWQVGGSTVNQLDSPPQRNREHLPHN